MNLYPQGIKIRPPSSIFMKLWHGHRKVKNWLCELFPQITYHFIDFFMLKYCGITFPRTRPQLIKLCVWSHTVSRNQMESLPKTTGNSPRFLKVQLRINSNLWRIQGAPSRAHPRCVCVSSLQLWFWTNNTCTAHVSTTLSELRLLYVMIYSAFPRYTDFCSHRNCMA